MNTETKLWKWVLIVGLMAIAMLLLYPPKDKLKPGIDLAGGTSLVYEIDMTGLPADARQGLAERVMNILKTRVDPNSQFNLVWRPIGNNRLEIQMPRPPAEARERRAAYETARDKIRTLNVTKGEIDIALSAPLEQREAALNQLARGVAGRAERLVEAGKAWDAYLAVRGGSDLGAEISAQAEYEEAVEAVLATNLLVGRVSDVMALSSSEQKQEIERLKTEYPSYVSAIEETVAAHKAWAAKRGSLEDPEDLKRLLRGAGVLEFRVLAGRDQANPAMLTHPSDATLREPIGKYVEQLQKRGPRPKAGDNYEWFAIEDVVKFTQAKSMDEATQRLADGPVVIEKYAGSYYVLAHVVEGDSKYGLTQRSPSWSLKGAFASRDYSTGRPSVDFQLDPRGGAQFAEVTQLNIGRELAIFLDGVATSHATIQSRIAERGQITGLFTPERVTEIVRRLEAGSLPARLKDTPLQEKNTGPSLGERNREMGLTAAYYAMLAVGVFMVAYYWFAGVLANVALVLNLLFVLAIMAALEATFTLQGIGGLVLTVGMAVDANVLINERIREERSRGVALAKAVKIGYEKAFATIVDSNLTTLITCVILGYVGSEEIKGFAMTLGFGVCTSVFTATFVTRLILVSLIDAGVVKSLPMMQVIGRPNVNWIAMKKFLWPISTTLVVLGLGLFIYLGRTDKEAVYDIEFLGGTSVQIELAEGVHMTAAEVRTTVAGDSGHTGASAAGWLRTAAQALREAEVKGTGTVGEFELISTKLTPAEMNTMMRTTFEGSLALGGYRGSGTTATFETRSKVVKRAAEEGAGETPTKPEDGAQTEEAPSDTAEVVIDLAAFKQGVADAADYVEKAAVRLEAARIQTVSDIDDTSDEERAFEIITVESNKELVRAAILGAMGDKLEVQRPINYVVVTDVERAPTGTYPILEDHAFLGQVIGGDAPNDIRTYKGGVAMVFDQLSPPQTIDAIDQRLKQMRLQPQFEKYESRDYEVIGLQSAGQTAKGAELYSRIALVVNDQGLLYADNPILWEDRLAVPEMEQAREALSAEKSLSKVVQFAPQIAARIQQQALISMVLALGAIVAYVWVRFGTMQYGLAAIVALVHDVSIVLGIIAVSDMLGIGDFRVDLAMIAALLTVIGYSLNDTIVVFDRIRENRGKMSALSTNMINNSINMTMSRTLLTSFTTFLAVAVLFFFGGPGVHGFSFAMMCGVVVGTYSSIAIAAPLLQNRRLLHTIVYLLIAGGVFGFTTVVTDNTAFQAVVGILMAILFGVGFTIERRMDAPIVNPHKPHYALNS